MSTITGVRCPRLKIVCTASNCLRYPCPRVEARFDGTSCPRCGAKTRVDATLTSCVRCNWSRYEPR
ncbi:MAG TPA: hypothetical protein VN903_14200 [Polyangia bacterium]|nr:hypothetical protein [Polyangia bacterium]